MDKEIRNTLRNVVTQCRRLLEDETSKQLQGRFGIHSSGTIEPSAGMTHLSDEDRLCREDLIAHLSHIGAVGFDSSDAFAQLTREIAFTHLNRLCAYKLMERREVFINGERFREAVSRGTNSNGFKFFLAEHSVAERLFQSGNQESAYRMFLDHLGTTLSDEIGVLFNPNDPANRLYPSQRILNDVLERLNVPELAEVWGEDEPETIGWVYQYFTPKEMRDKARSESTCPQNAYELAFRNQFYTPAYVVRFLTDNTLGRIWYEMRRGDTSLNDRCKYLIRSDEDVFLREGDSGSGAANEVQYREAKDPRHIRVLDPACGSGHFLLYCFDLLEDIYLEAYDDHVLGESLRRDFPDREKFIAEIPVLILAHNLYGIDIDLRATQIAGLALWLRCHKSFKKSQLKKDRPKILRSNIVCAEPMPGEKKILKEFTASLQPRVLGQLVEHVFDKMQLAGEAGSLLRIEKDIRSAIATAHRQWSERPKEEQLLLFDSPEKKPTQQALFDVRGISDDQFWNEAESKVLLALRSFASEAQNGEAYQRRLFADDAAQGFALIDVCQEQFDVVLMNPPFGEALKTTTELLDTDYKIGKWDLSSAFVMRAVELCPDGGIGIISTRIPLFTIAFEKWRNFVFQETGKLFCAADLGGSVLDTAMVETAAYCIATGKNRSGNEATFIPAYKELDPKTALDQRDKFISAPLSSFQAIPGFPLAYWLPPELLQMFSDYPAFEPEFGLVKQGLGTTDDFRFCRLRFEVPAQLMVNLPLPEAETTLMQWVPYVKGDFFSPYLNDYPIVVEWSNDGFEVKEYNRLRYGSASRHVVNESLYGKAGLVFPRRTRRFVPRYYPSGMIFSVGGQSIFPAVDPLTALGFMSTSYASVLTKAMLGRVDIDPQFEVGVIKRLPFPESVASELAIKESVGDAVRSVANVLALDETAASFVRPWREFATSVNDICNSNIDWLRENEQRINDAHEQIEKIVAQLLNASDECREFCAEDFSLSREDFRKANEGAEHGRRIVSYLVGIVFGRWDARIATGSQFEQLIPDPLEPYQACSPGMLTDDGGMPVKATPTSYLLSVDADGILVDDPENEDDIIRQTSNVLEALWPKHGDANEKELCELLKVRDLRDYLRKPNKGGFWDDHIRQYAKKPRKAPIYWLLQSSSKNYGLWLYYHRLDRDMLFKALLNYVEPKIQREENRLIELRSEKSTAGDSGSAAKKLDRDIEKQEDLIAEIRDFDEKLRKVAELHLEPELNDGVVLNIAPLHELVPWKEAKKYWNELLDGKYEWSSIGKQLREKGLVE